MNKYRVGLFHVTGQGVCQDLETWLELAVRDGYHLVGRCLPVANEGGIYILATMALDDGDDDDD